MMYSLINTAKLNGVDPETYLTRVLSTIADHPVNQVHELLPWNIDIGEPKDKKVFVERLLPMNEKSKLTVRLLSKTG